MFITACRANCGYGQHRCRWTGSVSCGGLPHCQCRFVQPGDGLGMHCAQPENQPFPVYSPDTEPENEPCHAGCPTERNRRTRPRIYENTQHFMVKGCAVALVDVVGRADAVDFPWSANPIQCKPNACVFRYRDEVTGVFFMSYQFGAEPLPSGQFAGNACLHSKQQSFMLFRKAVEYLAANRESHPPLHVFRASMVF